MKKAVVLLGVRRATQGTQWEVAEEVAEQEGQEPLFGYQLRNFLDRGTSGSQSSGP